MAPVYLHQTQILDIHARAKQDSLGTYARTVSNIVDKFVSDTQHICTCRVYAWVSLLKSSPCALIGANKDFISLLQVHSIQNIIILRNQWGHCENMNQNFTILWIFVLFLI